MKNKKQYYKASLGLLALTLFMFSCQKDELLNKNAEGKASFGFSEISAEKSNELKSEKAINETAAAVIISVENEYGELIYNQESLPLFNMNGKLITKALPLLAGTYLLTEFLVIDTNGNVIYLTPIAGSELAYLVNEALPLLFSIEKDNVTNIAPEVIIACAGKPEDFGYSAFSFNVVETFDFLISIFIYNENDESFELSSAHLAINTENSSIFSGNLNAATNNITVNGSHEHYTLIVEKQGYQTYENTFLRSELKSYNSSTAPLSITLEEDAQSNDGTVTDIDGNVYRTVLIGDQVWMAENLKTTTFNDGTSIPNVTNNSQWGNLTTPAYAWQRNNNDNKDIYGALYNWYTVETGNLCPEGWRVPTDDDWYQLTNYIGNINTGGKLKSCRQVNSPLGGECDTDIHPRWNENSMDYGIDKYGFSALPGGFRNEMGSFGGVGSHGFWWSSSTDSQDNSIRRSLRYNASTIHRSAGSKDVGFSVRCVK